MLANATRANEVKAPEATVQDFLRAYEAVGAGGLPPPSKVAPLLAHLTPELGRLLSRASQLAESSTCEGPPIVEGDLLTSLIEGFQSFRVQTCRQTSVTAVCSVQFKYQGVNDPAASVWVDLAMLRREGGKWLVSDFKRDAPWALAGLLSDRLKEAATEADACGH